MSRERNSKTMQLCRQVERALALALADVSAEAALSAVVLVAVVPAPHTSRLGVTVRVPCSATRPTGLTDASAALSRCHSRLRREVARSIHRKRAPELVFEVLPAEANDV